jgi:hypothetical protein
MYYNKCVTRRVAMSIVKQFHADTNTTYVYESTSYWDPEKGQSRAKRKLLGKEDPLTGELVPTGKRGRKKAEPKTDTTVSPSGTNEWEQKYLKCLEESREKDELIRRLRSENESLIKDNKKLTSRLDAVRKILE